MKSIFSRPKLSLFLQCSSSAASSRVQMVLWQPTPLKNLRHLSYVFALPTKTYTTRCFYSAMPGRVMRWKLWFKFVVK
jgi:hypothetical protein